MQIQIQIHTKFLKRHYTESARSADKMYVSGHHQPSTEVVSHASDCQVTPRWLSSDTAVAVTWQHDGCHVTLRQLVVNDVLRITSLTVTQCDSSRWLTCRDCRCRQCCRCSSAIWLASMCPTSRCNLSHSCRSCLKLVCHELAWAAHTGTWLLETRTDIILSHNANGLHWSWTFLFREPSQTLNNSRKEGQLHKNCASTLCALRSLSCTGLEQWTWYMLS